ncbi:MAG: type VI secretion system tip protein VgrG [Phycisphaerales bacterium]|nr:MAG: type VI secretion system tip protein VgrG [Phycisphaerales bacterium]
MVISEDSDNSDSSNEVYSELVLRFSDESYPPQEVARFRGVEGLCQLYRFELQFMLGVVHVPSQLYFDKVVGKPATLEITVLNRSAQEEEEEELAQRWFHGIVSRFEFVDEFGPGPDLVFRVELVPAVWQLTHRYNSRIFQGKTVQEIITDVLTKGGIATDRFRFVLEGEYEPRDYCVQYRETDYNFISRLMEEEGIWWYFEHTREHHTLVMADAPSAYAAIEGNAQLNYVSPSGLVAPREHVSRFRLGQSVRPGAVVLRDFNFENPPLDLEAKADAARDPTLVFSDYPGEHDTQARGTTLAIRRMEEFESGRLLGVGVSDCTRLGPGRTFDLENHAIPELNRSYLLTSTTHEGCGEGGAAVLARSIELGGSLLMPGLIADVKTVALQEKGSLSDLADALLEIIDLLQENDPTAHRELTRWLYHAGQVSRDRAAIAAASGGNPLEALSIPNLADDVTHWLPAPAVSMYTCKFECIPAEVAFRPPRVTPWPVMRGSQTARVVGPEGEEIYTDEYGRVKVQFNWDREGEFNEKSSCWIRVSQGMAGGNYGQMFLPRVGQEVVVDFLEGDPDKPLIVGRVYNKDHMPPYTLPDEKTKSVIKTRSSKGGGGSHEIRFEDLKDSEQMLIYGKKDLHIRFEGARVENIEGDRNLTVGNDRVEEVAKNYHLKVKDENYNVEIGGDESLKVKGKASIKVAGTQSTDVGGDVVEKFGANHKHEVTQTYAAKALSIKLEASTGIELKCGGSSIVLTPAAIFIVGGPLVNINSGSGPPVGPVTAMATSPEAPVAPGSADTVEHGTDTTYAGGEEVEAAEAQVEVVGEEKEVKPTEEKKTTFIKIRLLNDEGEPVAGERYRITCADGTVKEGTLDSNGMAEVHGLEEGECDVTFPDLDETAWTDLA